MTNEDLAQIRTLIREELAAVESRLAAAIHAVESRLAAAIHAAEERAQEFARDIESNLLKAYNGYAESNQARLVRIETAEAANSQRPPQQHQ
jgi:hypothetical protein